MITERIRIIDEYAPTRITTIGEAFCDDYDGAAKVRQDIRSLGYSLHGGGAQPSVVIYPKPERYSEGVIPAREVVRAMAEIVALGLLAAGIVALCLAVSA